MIIRPGKAKKKLLGGEPYGGNGRSVKKRLPNRPWRPPVQGAQDLRTVRRGGRS